MNAVTYRILVVEDDYSISQAVAQQLAAWDMAAQVVTDFANVLGEFAAFDPHLVLLDIKLPFYSGYHWCQELRRVSKVPIIFISSASDSMNIVMTMNMGADDFIAKPFDLNVLLAKVQALLRRTYAFASNITVIEHRGAMLNTGDSTLTFQGETIPLSKNEYRILLTLMQNKGKVVSRERLMEALWATDSFVDENTLSVNVNRLRKRLEGAGLSGFITTQHGVGYIVK
ncbi:MAG: response regulator transcription factor [Clostridiales bacterium]|nr:response regulator transcription factor [Clostridiales bacterium]